MTKHELEELLKPFPDNTKILVEGTEIVGIQPVIDPAKATISEKSMDMVKDGKTVTKKKMLVTAELAAVELLLNNDESEDEL